MNMLPTFCGKDCGGNACPLIAEVEGERVFRVTNNPAGGRYLKGCRRGFSLPAEQSAPDRLRTPLIRQGDRGSGRFRAASWEEALSLTAAKLAEIRSTFGPYSVLSMSSGGCTSAFHATGPLLGRFLALFGGSTTFTGSYSCGAANFVLPFVLGDDWTAAGFDAATMEYSRMIILWGANVLETRQGTGVDQRLGEAKRRGVQIVVIDPRHTPTARQMDAWWLPIRPGTDAALMLAVLYVLLAEDLADRPFIAAHSEGFDELAEYVLQPRSGHPYDPRWAAEVCGIPADTIIKFARAYACSKPAMLLPGFSIQRVQAGEETYRLAIALQVATGNFGVRGGSTGSLNHRLPAPRVGRLPVPKTDKNVSVPVARWPDAVIGGSREGFPSDIRAIYCAGSNYLNQGNDIGKNIQAFCKADFSVCHEIFLTPTARWCDVIFPAHHALEKEDIGIPWLGNFLTYKRPVARPPGSSRCDYEIFCDLADRLGFGQSFSEGRSARDWIQLFLDQSDVIDQDELRRSGLYLGTEQERVGLADFSADPAAHPLRTPSGKVQIASPEYHRQTGFPSIPTWRAAEREAAYPLLLLTPKTAYRTHSQGSNLAEIQRVAAHALEMNPADAAARKLQDGQQVRLFSPRGQMHVALRISEGIRPGVVCLPEGQWVQLDGEGCDHAGSANILTSTDATLPSVSNVTNAVAVNVEPVS